MYDKPSYMMRDMKDTQHLKAVSIRLAPHQIQELHARNLNVSELVRELVEAFLACQNPEIVNKQRLAQRLIAEGAIKWKSKK
jgi:hypothetical protein